jgi:nitrogen fixation protein FixH
MSLLLSLFGGMFLTALLYGFGRRLRLSNFWAAVLACGLPTLAYILFAFATGPTLDVITLHMVAYPTISVLLYQLYGDKANHAQTMHWAPKLMIAFFLGLTVLFSALIYIAGEGLPPALAQYLLPDAQGKNLHTGFAGVVAHKGGDAAKGIGAHLRNAQKLKELGWSVEVQGIAQLKAGEARDVTVRITDLAGRGVDQASVALALARPGDKPAQSISLNRLGGGAYHTQLAPDQPGTWVVFTTLDAGKESVHLEHTTEIN